MGKVIEFIREKIFFIAIILVVIVVVIIILGLVMGNDELTSYKNIEKNMVAAAKDYYEDRENRLPTTINEKVNVSLSVLVDGKYIKEVKDPQDSDTICTGRVETTKASDGYLYEAYLNCGSNYINKNLADELTTNLEKDENGNGLYQVGNNYIFKGDNVKNYVEFNGELWKIVKIDSSKDIELLKSKRLESDYVWDDRYNIETETSEGINDYNISRIKDSLNEYYNTAFDDEIKSKIVKKEFCTGKRGDSNSFDNSIECATKTELYIGLLTASEYYQASLDPNCKNFGEIQCDNYNYFSEYSISTWTITGSISQSNRVYYISNGVFTTKASNQKSLRPVIFLSSSVVYTGGNGTFDDPYIIK
ncbi:MAG TPA: hypothetical protein PKY25_02825 [Bacilli bacterium]|nr:hypothetical protein [Bacilli bacterium]